MRTPRTVLLATDGADDAAMARDAATQLSVAWGAQLHVVHAWHTPVAPVAYPGYVVPQEWPASVQAGHRVMLDAVCSRIVEAGGAVPTPHLVVGGAVDAVVDVAAEIGADLIVMGTHGRGTLGRIFAGSVTTGVLHHATAAVLVVRRRGAAWPPTRVLIGDDYTPAARDAADWALTVASALHAEVQLIHALSPLPDGYPADVLSEDASLEHAIARTSERAAELSTVALPVRAHTALGDAANLLIAAAEHGTGLIAVGRHTGKRGLLRFGSVSNYLLHEAPCALLVGPAAAVDRPPERTKDPAQTATVAGS